MELAFLSAILAAYAATGTIAFAVFVRHAFRRQDADAATIRLLARLHAARSERERDRVVEQETGGEREEAEPLYRSDEDEAAIERAMNAEANKYRGAGRG